MSLDDTKNCHIKGVHLAEYDLGFSLVISEICIVFALHSIQSISNPIRLPCASGKQRGVGRESSSK